jgi:hypothetical protein
MSYLGISIREAVKNINSSVNGWFLPAIQRPYVWGSRYENELYICKLFDSLLRGYPIGGLIIWNTEEKVPYREFMDDYYNETDGARLVEEGLWSRKDKWLVYDGQQRLQTLYSCLKYKFNNKILIYNLLYELSGETDNDNTGFRFENPNGLEWSDIKMNELFSRLPDQAKQYERDLIKRFKTSHTLSEKEEDCISDNLAKLWKVFVEEDKKSLSYFPISTSRENEVNEIFERLNSGGMALSQADLLFSKIKAEYYDFEERLQSISKKIYNNTNKGYLFNAYNILQLLYLIIKGNIRVDPKNVKNSEIVKFEEEVRKLEPAIISFFVDYVWNKFHINNNSIIPRKNALLPIMVYFYEIYKKGYKYKDLSKNNINKINHYFIRSQINDWNLQTFIDKFSSIIKDDSEATKNISDFPYKKIEDEVKRRKNRNVEIYEEAFIDYVWFSLKILTPQRIYQYDPDIKDRFNPEIDHIFPKKLKGATQTYISEVDVLWNLQPVKGDINSFKTNHNPLDFFLDKITDKNGKIICGSKYIADYDYLFPKDKDDKIDFNNKVWKNHKEFIKERRNLMIKYLKSYYGIDLL